MVGGLQSHWTLAVQRRWGFYRPPLGRGYLAAYDRDTIFAQEDSARNVLLLTFVKDIAIWHLINLCNAGTDRTLRQDRYERAISWLKGVMKGDITPDLPKLETSSDNPGIISYGSNPKRSQHF